MAKNARLVIGGVDTHADTHTAAVIDSAGRLLGHREFPSDLAGCKALLAWVRRHGRVEQIGVEGTGSYGAGLMRLLNVRGVEVIEVDRPDRKLRRAKGKSDPIDAEAAARAVLSRRATGTPKSRAGVVEAIRVLRVTRDGAVKARTAALNTLVSLARTAPEPLAGQLHGLSARKIVRATCDWSTTAKDLSDPVAATRVAISRLSGRVRQLDLEIKEASTQIAALLKAAAPALLERFGVGPETAGQLLVTAGDNPGRLTDDSSFALLTGVAPLLASSGRTNRHRLNRGGDRQANSALFTIVLSRMAGHPPTQAYVARRTAEGLSKPEIMRCLKRYVARELFPLILQALTPEIETEDHLTAA